MNLIKPCCKNWLLNEICFEPFGPSKPLLKSNFRLSWRKKITYN